MPSACVHDCGLHVVDGILEIDWATVGAGHAVAQSGPITVPLDAAGPDYIGPYGTQRLAYTNNTCRPQLVEYQAYVPYTSLDMSDGNWWTVALYWTHRIGTPPPANSFDVASVALVRTAYAPGEAGQHPLSAPIPGRHVLVTVQPGQTLHMMASIWKRLLTLTPGAGDRIYVEHVALQYRRWPAAA